jgi:DNA polymerase
MLSLDFETRSQTDLITEGLYNYAQCPTTDVICMYYSIDGGEPIGWHRGDPIPEEFYSHDIHAWNAAFERMIWNHVMVRYGAKPIPLGRFRCTMYKSRCNNMPGALGNAARCLNVPVQKQARGRELIKLLCVPLEDGSFCEDPDLLEEMDSYCADDVRAEQGVDRQLREPTDEEWEDYFANERINDRGFLVDIELCEAAQIYAKEEEADLVAWIEELTEGEVVKARGENLKAWIVERLTAEQELLLVKYRNDERKLSLDKYNRFRLLALDDLDPTVREVVEASDFAQRSSVGKFKAMANIADLEDCRVRGALLANGASASGRYSSRGAQVHNFPRDCMDDPLAVRADFIDAIVPEDITDFYKKPMMEVLSHMLRPSILPAPGHMFIDSDWSAIEGRVAPWLCDGRSWADSKLRLYAEGHPVYEITAAGTFHCAVHDVTKDQRQVGKVQELSFQYGGGANAFMAMARNYGVVASKHEAEHYKKSWRRQNPWAEAIWDAIEEAAKKAVIQPGMMFHAGRTVWFGVEDVLAGGVTLFCQLPCGRVLTYPDARIEMVPMPWDKTDLRPGLTALRAAFVPKAGEKEWPRGKLWGGLLFENAVQGTSASLLRWALREAEKDDLPVVFHVHDQIVCEVPEAEVDHYAGWLEALMNDKPAWAEGLPVAAEVEIRERFGK